MCGILGVDHIAKICQHQSEQKFASKCRSKSAQRTHSGYRCIQLRCIVAFSCHEFFRPLVRNRRSTTILVVNDNNSNLWYKQTLVLMVVFGCALTTPPEKAARYTYKVCARAYVIHAKAEAFCRAIPSISRWRLVCRACV